MFLKWVRLFVSVEKNKTKEIFKFQGRTNKRKYMVFFLIENHNLYQHSPWSRKSRTFLSRISHKVPGVFKGTVFIEKQFWKSLIFVLKKFFRDFKKGYF